MASKRLSGRRSWETRSPIAHRYTVPYTTAVSRDQRITAVQDLSVDLRGTAVAVDLPRASAQRRNPGQELPVLRLMLVGAVLALAMGTAEQALNGCHLDWVARYS
ncbi:hypothetical protein GCM10020219_101200 [Nonomuraea dietziae]